VKLAAITTDFGQGKTQNTGRALDFMIQGDGFFVTRDGNQQLFTRAGSFTFDGAGKLITADGAVLQGWMANPDGTVDTNGVTGDLSVSYGGTKTPQATDAATLGGNLPSGAAVGATVQAQTTMYDGQGAEHIVSYVFTKTAADTWSVGANEVDSTGTVLNTFAATPASITFGPDGRSTSPSVTLSGIPWPGASDVVTSVTGMSQFSTGNAMNVTDQSGYAAGSLQSFALNDDGTIMGVFSNGERQAIGKLALATFNNPSGLVNMGNTSYAVGDNSGNALIGTAGSGSLGTLASGALEMSNVDLSEEFTGLIIAQRGFQANSRVITASDELLQDLVNLKR